ncbi:MAG: Glycosylphosphatidylinositol (GPI) anchor assembly protein [Vezdaea acicularis]|nr:MAG: Glycosylphosphatidylinositol (GPI) anchor assembly protein [Vezdaea acicularis]
MTATQSKPVKAFPVLGPIELLHTNGARTFTHIHPILLLTAYYLQFSALVADPVSGLLASLLPLAIIQTCYIVTCLPSASGSATAFDKGARGGHRKKPVHAKSVAGPADKAVSAILSLILSLVLGPPVLTAIMILFGAPLTTHIYHTLLAATHVSLLATYPLFYVFGVDGGKWRRIAGAALPLDEVFGATLGTFIGCWLGAVPIPLDWDRDWQAWPVTIITGGYLGYVVGKLAGEYVFKGKRVEFHEP